MTNSAESSRSRPLAAIILAAGKGTRMNSDLPKVVHPVAGRAIVWWVVDAVRAAGAERTILVVGYGADAVRDVFAGDDADIEYVVQSEQLGTGHATNCARELLADFDGDVLVLAGDGPLIREETIRAMHDRQNETGAPATLATSEIDDPTGYGRIIRNTDGRFEAIVEHKNATDEQRTIHEVYPSYACFDAKTLFTMLDALVPNELTGEYYVTDIPVQLREQGRPVELVDGVPQEDILSINTEDQLSEVDAILTARLEAART